MKDGTDTLRVLERPRLNDATLVLALGGWMDGGDVSTGTVRRLVDLLEAQPIAEIEPDSYYIYNLPGSMETASIIRPHVAIDGGILRNVDMPSARFYCAPKANLALFIGKEPNLRWRQFGDDVLRLAADLEVVRIVFVGSFGGAVPHTRQPRLYVSCSDEKLLREMLKFGVRPTEYEGPGSFTSYLMTRAATAGVRMTSLVAEIPGYLQGTNWTSIEAVTRRLAKILKLPLDLDSLRTASTEWEMQVSTAIDQNPELASKVRQLEDAYDDDLLKHETDDH